MKQLLFEFNDCKSGDLLLTRRSERRYAERGELKDKPWLQDGVAPQCRVNGLVDNQNKSGRVYIPSTEKQGFLESHLINYYGWIFNKITNPLSPGYVKPRK